MSAEADLERIRGLVGSALASLEASRSRIDDLNVYPVPDGDTGTNLTLTVRAVADAVGEAEPSDRTALARAVARAALMGARGNSGVILSQIVRGIADVLAEAANGVDPALTARALRGASDTAYRAVSRPVEGTMLSVIRELAEEAERRAGGPEPLGELLVDLVRHGEEAVARTPEQLEILREAGVVDAGGAGLVELLRGLAGAVTGETVPAAPAVATAPVGVDAVHLDPSRYRYCTVFVVEGKALDRDEFEARLESLGDSLVVVGDETALKVHVHTDDPGTALSLGTAAGTIEGVEIANMHEQQERRERRLSLVPSSRTKSGVVAVVAGDGNRLLFESLAGGGAIRVVEGGQTANPSTGELLGALQELEADEAVILPNNPNVRLTARHAAEQAGRPVAVVPTDSIPAGLAAALAYDGARSASENAAAMAEAAEAVAAGAVTRASRDVSLNGLAIRRGDWLGLADGEPVGGGDDFAEVALVVVTQLLADGRGVLTLLTGDEPPPLDGLLERLEADHPELEVEVHEGGQPHYPLLLGAE